MSAGERGRRASPHNRRSGGQGWSSRHIEAENRRYMEKEVERQVGELLRHERACWEQENRREVMESQPRKEGPSGSSGGLGWESRPRGQTTSGSGRKASGWGPTVNPDFEISRHSSYGREEKEPSTQLGDETLRTAYTGGYGMNE